MSTSVAKRRTRRMVSFSAGLALAAMLAAPAAGWAQPAAATAFPIAGKPIRIVVPFTAGGQTDVQARALGQKLAASLGVPVNVDNRPGAGTIIGTQEVVRAAPDGHTLLYTISTTVAMNPHLYSKLPYEPFRDLTPIMYVARSSTILTVPAAAPYNSVRELVDYAKKNPGKLTYGSFAIGSSSHLNGELLKQIAGIEMTHVPYKGSAEAIVALIGGQVDLVFDGPTTAITNAKAGKVKMLAVADDRRYKGIPDVPTMTEAGVPGIDLPGGMLLLGSPNLPADVVARINSEVAKAMQQPDVVKLFVENGTDPLSSSPQELTRAMRDMYERWGTAIRKFNIKLD